MQAQIDEAPQFKGKTHIAFTEWLFVCCRGGRADAPRFDNMGGALGAAGFLNMLIQNADVVPISDMTGGIEFAGIWKKRSRVYAVPAYYAFRMYSSAAIHRPVAVQNGSPTYDVHQGVTRLPEIANVPYLDVVAALNQSGDRLTLFCVNRHLSRDFAADVLLDGFEAAGKAEIEKLYADSIYGTNSEEEPDAVQPIQSTANVNGSKLHVSFRHESITRIELHSR
jgi:alpha-N-arabinofuranosidase